MAMKLNFRILEQKLTNLNNLLLPKKTIYNSNYNLNYYLNKKYNNLNNSFSPNKKFEKYINRNKSWKHDLANNFNNSNYDKININTNNKNILKKTSIKNKFQLNNPININNNNKFNNHYFKLIKNINNNNETNNKINKTEENYDDIERNLLNESVDLDLEKLSKKESENLSDDELSNLADELINTIRDKKCNSKEKKNILDSNINDNKNNNNKIIKKKTKINNNYIITNI